MLLLHNCFFITSIVRLNFLRGEMLKKHILAVIDTADNNYTNRFRRFRSKKYYHFVKQAFLYRS